MVARRRLIAGGALLLAAPAAFLSACGGSAADAPEEEDEPGGRPGTEVQGDAEMLAFLLSLEHRAVATWRSGAAHMRGADRTLAEAFLAREREHAARLSSAIRDLGRDPEQLAEASASRPLAARDRSALLDHGAAVASTAVAGYLDALPKLSDRGLRRLAASIVAVEAEHLALLDALRGHEAAPEAFVVGERFG